MAVLAGYRSPWGAVFRSNPGVPSRMAERMVVKMIYRSYADALVAMNRYIMLPMEQPRFSNARRIRNLLDRARLRQANRLFATATGPLNRQTLEAITAVDFRGDRVFEDRGSAKI